MDTAPALDAPQSAGIADPQKSALALTSYDDVISLGWGDADLSDIALAHPSLPIPSYVEVTRLDTGRTILVRVSERATGPLAQGRLSSAARGLLGLGPTGHQAFRVRRVNPIEQDRLALRQGMPAAARLDTPDILLGVLRKRAAQLKLVDPPPHSNKGDSEMADRRATVSNPPEISPHRPTTSLNAQNWGASFASSPSVHQPQAATAPWYVQIAALANAQKAQDLATASGAQVRGDGIYFRVQFGPYPDRTTAAAALGRLQAKGYPEARITR